MKFNYECNENKNLMLKQRRGVNFDDVITAIEDDKLLADLKHHNQKKYPGQRIFVVEIERYGYVIPYVERASQNDLKTVFLKTVYASRKFTKKYIQP